MLNPDSWRKNASPMVSSWGSEVSWRTRLSARHLGPCLQAYAEALDQAKSRVSVKRRMLSESHRRTT